MFTASQLVAHAIGDYVIQTDWMASEKTKKSSVAAVHAVTYTLPFLFLTTSIPALLFIVGTHFVMDRWRLARYVCWAKNWLQPKRALGFEYRCRKSDCKTVTVAWEPQERPFYCPSCDSSTEVHLHMARNYPWSKCQGTGYYEGRPAWMAVWLMIIVDNVIHVTCNAIAIAYL